MCVIILIFFFIEYKRKCFIYIVLNYIILKLELVLNYVYFIKEVSIEWLFSLVNWM